MKSQSSGGAKTAETRGDNLSETSLNKEEEDDDDDDNSDEENDQLVNEQPKLDDESLGPNVKLDHRELEDFIKRKKLTGYDIERTEIRTIYQIQKIKAGL